MSDKMISLRLDDESIAALALLTKDGASRSVAIREALIEAAGRRRSEAVRVEVERLAADPQDRAEAQAILEFMESMRDPW